MLPATNSRVVIQKLTEDPWSRISESCVKISFDIKSYAFTKLPLPVRGVNLNWNILLKFQKQLDGNLNDNNDISIAFQWYYDAKESQSWLSLAWWTFLHGSRLLTELALNRGGWGASKTFGRHNSKVGKGTTGFIIITTRISIQR